MINTWTKVCLGRTILCVQTQKKGWWWQRSTIFLSLPLSLFFLVMIVKKAKKSNTKTAHYQPLLFSVKYHSYDTKQYFGKQNEKQLMKTEYWLLLSDIIRCQEEKYKVCTLREKQNKAKNVSLVEELHQLSFINKVNNGRLKVLLLNVLSFPKLWMQ